MRRHPVVSLVCVAALCFGAAALRGEPAVKDKAAPNDKASVREQPADLRAALVGTWKMASMKVNGEKNTLPDRSVTLKHVTPAGFTWLSYPKDSGQVYRAAGGTYTLRGDEYTETIEYGVGSDFEGIKNASHPFKCRIEGDTWHHNGKLAGGTTIDEEWTRVKPSDGQKRP
jgi:hypothetical protein